MDDCKIISQTKKEADAVFVELEKRKFKLPDEGTMEEHLGILITHNDDGSYRMSQPYLIDRIIDSIPGMTDARGAKSPAYSSVILTKEGDGVARKEHWISFRYLNA